MSAPPVALVSPRRLGGLLRDTRVARGVSVDNLASQSFFTPGDILAIEAGERELADRELAEVLSVYHVDGEQLLPSRTQLVIDLDDRLVSAGGQQKPLTGRAPTPDEVLASYLSLVYTLRRTEPGGPIVLREADLDVLARALDLAKPAVTTRLHSLMVEPSGEVSRRSGLLRGRVLVPLAGVVVAATAIGTLLLVQTDEGQTVTTETDRAGSESGSPAEALEPAFVMTNPDGSTTPVYIGENLSPADLPEGAVGLAPPTQQYPNGMVVVNADGQPVPADLPPNEVWLGDAQVLERDDDDAGAASARR